MDIVNLVCSAIVGGSIGICMSLFVIWILEKNV